MYNKSTQNAISAVSALAEVYNEEGTIKLSSSDIAEARNLPKPFVAKLLTILAQAKIIVGSPGPKGGYTLARPPTKIVLFDISCLFERDDDELSCPYGPGFCGHNKEPCPLHEGLENFRENMRGFLQKTTFEIFVGKTPLQGE